MEEEEILTPEEEQLFPEEPAPEKPEEEAPQPEPVAEAAPSPNLDPMEEVESFRRKYPAADLEELLSRGHPFSRFARGKLGRQPLEEVYREYREFLDETREETLRTLALKRSRSTGAATTRGAGDYGLTDSQKELLEEWNRKYPREKMTPKEYAKLLKR